MITFILICGVLLRVVPMIGVLWLIWHVSRQHTPTGLRGDREITDRNLRPNEPGGETNRRARTARTLRARRPATGGKPARRVRALAPMSAPPTAS